MSEDLPQGWAKAPLAEIATLIFGQSPPSSTYNETGKGLPFFQGKAEFGRIYPEIRKWCTSSHRIAEYNDILLSVRAPVGPTNLAPEKCGIGRGLAAIRPFNDISLNYLLHFFRYFEAKLSAQGTGTTFSAITKPIVQRISVPIPPATQQTRIASKIDELFSDIEEGERALERVRGLVEKYRQSVLKAAVTGELTREWREKNKDKLESGEDLLKRILKARREAWEADQLKKMAAKGQKPKNNDWKKKYKEPATPNTSNLPDLPDGWTWASPVQLESTKPNALTIGPFGSNLKVSDYTDHGVPLIFVRNIRNGNFSDTKFVSPQKAAELKSHSAKAGDILITKMGDPPGDACVYQKNMPDAIITSDCIKWTLSSPLVDAEFFASFINSWFGKRQISEITKGVAQQKVNLANYRKIGIPLPPLEDQRCIVQVLEDKFSMIDKILKDLAKQEKQSAALRQAILKSAFSGKLVPQDPNDEPASELLKRIAAEKVKAESAKPKRAKTSAQPRGRRSTKKKTKTV